MSPRDEFAAAALTGILAEGTGVDEGTDGRPSEFLVRRAYNIADEMIRQQKPSADDFEIFELACAVSDVFVRLRPNAYLLDEERQALIAKLDYTTARLEEATRPRAMRKVRP